MTLPDYKEMAQHLYDLIAHNNISSHLAVAEIEEALKQAERVGKTLGKILGKAEGYDNAYALVKEHL